jgi:hypothetical protein
MENGMTKQNTRLETITGVMNALRYSLASYSRFARPWVHVGAKTISESITRVAEVHRQHVIEIGELLVARHRHVESRTFPSRFTGFNDLSIEYLLPWIIEDQIQILRVIKATARAITDDVAASNLLAKIVAVEKQNLQILRSASDHRHSIDNEMTLVTNRRRAVEHLTNEFVGA